MGDPIADALKVINSKLDKLITDSSANEVKMRRFEALLEAMKGKRVV